eukprot:6662497-Alexandrium_andersonii.AAC.1
MYSRRGQTSTTRACYELRLMHAARSGLGVNRAAHGIFNQCAYLFVCVVQQKRWGEQRHVG